jgi:hypothetical protein
MRVGSFVRTLGTVADQESSTGLGLDPPAGSTRLIDPAQTMIPRTNQEE